MRSVSRLAAVALALAVVLALAGCGGEGGEGGDSGDQPSAEPAPPAAAQPLTVTRTGGIAGIRETVTVAPDGTWRRTGRTAVKTGVLTAEQRSRLTRMATDPAVAAEAQRPPEPTPCADGYDLTLTVGSTTVRWSQCDPDTAPTPVSAGIARLVLASTA